MRVFEPMRAKKRRLKLKMTQGDVAKILGITKSRYNQAENGRGLLRCDRIGRLAYALKTTESYFFVNKEEKN